MVNRETIRETLRGESKNVELKETLPESSEKYTRTAVAFANTQGGTLVLYRSPLPTQNIGETSVKRRKKANVRMPQD